MTDTGDLAEAAAVFMSPDPASTGGIDRLLWMFNPGKLAAITDVTDPGAVRS